jgi:O-acetyl-ADP-ribose deacetylase (regulator of RNase III)
VKQMGTLPAGGAVITAGGRLTAKYVIHTVGPIYRGGDQGEEKALESCHRESIRLADEYSVDSLSFPAISTGAYGYPVSAAAGVAVSAVAEGLRSATHLKMVRFVLFDVSTLRAYTRAAESLRDPKDGSPYGIERSAR